jgi:urease accessory protein
MVRAIAVIRKPAVKAGGVADTAWLDSRARQSRGAPLVAHGGLEFQLDLDHGAMLNDGDAVRLEDGRLVQVMAAPEPLLEISAENVMRLMRLAWHLGGRHVAAEITAGAVYVEDDPALGELARGQGCSVTKVMRPFRPEHADEHVCGHHGHHHSGHHHAHGHHSHGCDHGHGHKHKH